MSDYELKPGDILFGCVYMPSENEGEDDEENPFELPEEHRNPFRVWKDLSYMSPERRAEKAREMKRDAERWDREHLAQKTENNLRQQEKILAMSDEEYMAWYANRVRKQKANKRKESKGGNWSL